jgi:hypothetical protein
MRNCQVCNTAFGSGSLSYCPNCQWPVRAITAIPDLALGQDVLQWVKRKYQETTPCSTDSRGINLPLSSSKRISVSTELNNASSIRTESILQPSSKMNSQIGGDDAQNIESLKLDLVALSHRIKIAEDQQINSDIETNKLSQKSQELEQAIQRITKSIMDMSSFLDKQNKKNQELDSQYDQWHSAQEKSGKYDHQIQDLIKEQQKQIGEINWLKDLLTSRHVGRSASGSNSAAILPVNVPMVATSDLNFAPEELDLLRDYNSNPLEIPNSLRDRAINVSIDEETFSRLRDGNESNIAFKPDRKGNYLIITRGGYRYLVPNKQRKIITHIYAVTKAVYKCDGYSESYKDFRLIKPALVYEELIDCWKLSQQGILEFT